MKFVTFILCLAPAILQAQTLFKRPLSIEGNIIFEQISRERFPKVNIEEFFAGVPLDADFDIDYSNKFRPYFQFEIYCKPFKSEKWSTGIGFQWLPSYTSTSTVSYPIDDISAIRTFSQYRPNSLSLQAHLRRDFKISHRFFFSPTFTLSMVHLTYLAGSEFYIDFYRADGSHIIRTYPPVGPLEKELVSLNKSSKPNFSFEPRYNLRAQFQYELFENLRINAAYSPTFRVDKTRNGDIWYWNHVIWFGAMYTFNKKEVEKVKP